MKYCTKFARAVVWKPSAVGTLTESFKKLIVIQLLKDQRIQNPRCQNVAFFFAAWEFPPAQHGHFQGKLSCQIVLTLHTHPITHNSLNHVYFDNSVNCMVTTSVRGRQKSDLGEEELINPKVRVGNEISTRSSHIWGFKFTGRAVVYFRFIIIGIRKRTVSLEYCTDQPASYPRVAMPSRGRRKNDEEYLF